MKKILSIFIYLIIINNAFSSWNRQGISFVSYDGISKKITCRYWMGGDKVTRYVKVWFELEDLIKKSPIESITLFDWKFESDSINLKTKEDEIANGFFRNGFVYCYSVNNKIYTVDTKKKEVLWWEQSKDPIAGLIIKDNLLYIAKKNGDLLISSNITGKNIKKIAAFLPAINSLQQNPENTLLALTIDRWSPTYIYDLATLSLQDSFPSSTFCKLISNHKVMSSSSSSSSQGMGLIEYDLKQKKLINRLDYNPPEYTNLIQLIECEERYLALELKEPGGPTTILIMNRNNGEIGKSILINSDFSSSDTYLGCKLIAYRDQNLILAKGANKDIGSLFRSVEDKISPAVVIVSPSIKTNEQFTTQDDFIFVKGKATDSSLLKTIVINNEQVPFLSQTGDFNGYIKLEPGLNELVIKATDIYNNTSTNNIKILKTEKETRGLKINSANKEYNNASAFAYHALVIAEQDYKDEKIKDLSFPFLDAENLKKILTLYYSFDENNISFLKNPTRNQIIKSFDSLLNVISPKDHLLIFYAGHGVFDTKLKQGYWLPSDADINNKGTWVSNNDIKDYIAGIDSKHTLLISDACFSGSIFEYNRDVKFEQVMDKLLSKKARTAMTSGLDNPVPDKSLFLQYLLKSLVENKNPYIKASELFSTLQEAVLANTENIPQYGVIRNANHEGGEFIFLKKK